MIAIKLVALALLATVCLAQPAPGQVVQLMRAYNISQNDMSASETAKLFSSSGQVQVPAGTQPIIGTKAITSFYAGYFASMASNEEVVLGEFFVDGNAGSYVKQVSVVNSQGCIASLQAINWFTVQAGGPAAPAIQTFSVAFDPAHFVFHCAGDAVATKKQSSVPLVASALACYNASQNAMDAAATAACFSPTGAAYLPLGASAPLVGSTAIETGYANYFQSVNHTVEVVTTDFITVNNVGAYAKLVVSSNDQGCTLVMPAINWFEVDLTTGLIDNMFAQWNADQYVFNCKSQ